MKNKTLNALVMLLLLGSLFCRQATADADDIGHGAMGEGNVPTDSSTEESESLLEWVLDWFGLSVDNDGE